MDNYFLYFQKESESEDWGLYIPTCGYQHTYPGDIYPLPGHPKTHTFNWEMGRRLNGCYIVYITSGKGEFETTTKHWEVNPGNVIILAPDEWHRYKPTQSTGWEEYWIGFQGELSNRILSELLPASTSYIKDLGFQDELIFLFNKSLELTKKNSPGCRKILSGIVMQLMAYVISNQKKEASREQQLSKQIISFIKDHLNEVIDFKRLAGEYHLSYNRFRSIFKNETGTSLQQYLIHERLEYAKKLIINTSFSLKEISEKTGFDSSFYFSKVFKNKMGYPPRDIRIKEKLTSKIN